MNQHQKTVKFQSVLSEQSGQSLTEYLVLLLLISVASIGSVRILGGTVLRKVKEANKEISSKVTWEIGSDDRN